MNTDTLTKMRATATLCALLTFCVIDGCSSRTVTSDLCSVCAARRPREGSHRHHHSLDVCQAIIDFQSKIYEIKLDARNEVHRISNVFDGDVTGLRRREVVIPVPANVSMMSRMYNRLVSIHLYRQLSETSRWKSSCSSRAVRSHLLRHISSAACKLRIVIRATDQMHGFGAVCRKEMTVPDDMDDGCPSFHEHAYNSLQFLLEGLETVGEEIRGYKNEYGC